VNLPRVRWLATGLAAALLPAGAAFANDSSAELAAGGLVLLKNETIAIQREDLVLTPSQVRVRYEMRNDSGRPLTLRVAFPLPDVPIDTPGGLIAAGDRMVLMRPPPSGPDFMNFRVRSDGQEIVPQVEVRAVLADGRDVARELRRIGGDQLIMRPGFFPAAGDRPLSAETQRKLTELGALKPLPEGGYELPWRTHVAFHWQQTFAPGITVVEHSYKPILGFRLILVEPGRIVGSGGEEPAQAFCLSSAAQQDLRGLSERTLQARRKTSGDDNPALTAYTLGYVLKTAQNWRGPIGTFHLVVQGERAGIGGFGDGDVGLIALCSDLPLRAVAPRRLEATVNDYRPMADLRVLYITH